jgi:hypothetical protein
MSVPYTMDLISHDDDVLIFTYNHNVKRFMSALYGEEKIQLIESYSYLLTGNLVKMVYFLSKIFAAKRKFSVMLSKYRDCDVYFFFPAFGHFEAWMINLLSSNNRVYYCPDASLKSFGRDNSWAARIQSAYIEHMFSQPVVPLSAEGVSRYYTVSEAFLENIGAQVVDISPDLGALSSIVCQKYCLGKKSILLLSGGVVEDRFVALQDYVVSSDTMIRLLVEQVGDASIAVKIHPRFERLYSEENKLFRIDDAVPANLIYQNFSVVIGYCSATLFEAANDGLTAISLLEYFPAANVETQASSKSYLLSNLAAGREIFFPKNMEEIQTMVSGALVQGLPVDR